MYSSADPNDLAPDKDSPASAKAPSRRGFASMSKERRRAVASGGGKAAQATGRAHQFTSAEARDCGRQGGLKVSQDRAHMADLGRRGGESRRRQAQSPPPAICPTAPQYPLAEPTLEAP
jgi:general stress protein YciG